MGTGGDAAFVLSWAQTWIDGRRADVSALAAGASWSWQGQAVRLDGRQDVLVLDGARGIDALRARAGRAVRRRMGAAAPLPAAEVPPLAEDFAVTDGRVEWPATVIARDGAPPGCRPGGVTCGCRGPTRQPMRNRPPGRNRTG